MKLCAGVQMCLRDVTFRNKALFMYLTTEVRSKSHFKAKHMVKIHYLFPLNCTDAINVQLQLCSQDSSKASYLHGLSVLRCFPCFRKTRRSKKLFLAKLDSGTPFPAQHSNAAVLQSFVTAHGLEQKLHRTGMLVQLIKGTRTRALCTHPSWGSRWGGHQGAGTTGRTLLAG